tara:strand:- start:1280 stop:1531 length:252 start_codon:yes stop_codon:yes gene_type:complete
MSDDRLARAERKIDELQQVVVRQGQVDVEIKIIMKRQTDITNKIDRMGENIQALSNQSNNRFSERVFWIVVVALVSYATRMMS